MVTHEAKENGYLVCKIRPVGDFTWDNWKYQRLVEVQRQSSANRLQQQQLGNGRSCYTIVTNRKKAKHCRYSTICKKQQPLTECELCRQRTITHLQAANQIHFYDSSGEQVKLLRRKLGGGLFITQREEQIVILKNKKS